MIIFTIPLATPNASPYCPCRCWPWARCWRASTTTASSTATWNATRRHAGPRDPRDRRDRPGRDGHARPAAQRRRAHLPPHQGPPSQLDRRLGRYFPTQHWEACLKAPYVDYVVRGHGEVVFKGLVDTLRHGDDPLTGLALAFREEWKVGGERPDTLPINNSTNSQFTNSQFSNSLAPIPHPDHLPDFPYHRVDVPRYIRRTFMGNRTMTHHSSYGCPFFCNFCAVVNMVNGRWLAQSAERVANTVRHDGGTWGVDAVEFDDNNFFTSEARVAEFAERLLSMGLRIGWWGEARIDTMLKYSDRTWELMRDSGLKMVFLGAESGSDETLKRMNKGGKASTDKTLEIAGKMARYGIVPEMSFVMGNPPDPEADMRQTLAFIRQVKQINPAPRSSSTCTRPCRWPASCMSRPRPRVSSSPRRWRSGSARSGRSSRSAAAPRCPGCRTRSAGSRDLSGCSTPTTPRPPT